MNMLINKFHPRCLSRFFVLLIASVFCLQAQASDLDIYQDGGVDDVVITLMLDVSGSMNDFDYGPGDFTTANGTGYSSVTLSGITFRTIGPRCASTPTYRLHNPPNSTVPGYEKYKFAMPISQCREKPYTRRIDDLKMAVWDVTESLDPAFILGLGVYPINEDNDGNSDKTGKAGKIIVAANALEASVADPRNTSSAISQRDLIKREVSSLSAFDGTPAANAYAEATAYMLGRTTTDVVVSTNVRVTGYVDRSCSFFGGCRNDVYSCNSNSTSTFTLAGANWQNCSSATRRQAGVRDDQINYQLFPFDRQAQTTVSCGFFCTADRTYFGLQEQVTTNESSQYSGFPLSVSTTKAGSRYSSPVINAVSECGGNGIFFLTDGEPNGSGTDIATSLMKNATGTNSFTCSNSQLSNANTGSGNASAWTCMGSLAVDLDNRTNAPGTRIFTATSGFGPIFDSIGAAINNKLSEFPSDSRIPTLIEEGSLTLADCDIAGASADAKNLCKLGILGKGGFSFGQNSTDVSAAIKRFAEGTSGPQEKISTGTMSVPVDSLNIVQSQNEIYLPILGINRETPIGLWPGNLKKYQIKNGTIVAKTRTGTSTTTTLFSSRDGDFKTSVWDFWNTDSASQPDNADPVVGGARSKLLANSIPANGQTPATPPNRFAWINNGSALSRINVIGTTPSGFGVLTDVANERKINLFNFLGYPVPPGFNGTTTINDGTTLSIDNQPIVQSASNKVMGAVLHSTPQLITYSASINTDGEVGNRKDFLLFGSMDGALHLVDDDTGKEVFNFVPKEVLKRQGQAFMPGGTFTQNQGIPYGVDGPWTVYSVLANTLTDIRAKQVLTFGGLRMGGSNYYGLDLTSYTSPKLVYNVGSTYADSINSEGTLISNVVSAVTVSNAGSGPDFSAMGQTWGKPSVGFVTVGGKKTMVNFLPGGYDVCYEKPEFKLSSGSTLSLISGTTCANKTKAQGSAVYMVGVGTSEIDASTDNVKNINLSSTNKGRLLWSTDTGLRHSVVSEIRVLDRNNDGLSDHLYFSDLGGSVYRVDINNDKNTNFTASAPVKILDASGAATGSDGPPRFYERPLVTFVRLDNSQQVVATVTVGSGDRSSPLFADRSTPNRLYTVIDKDIPRADMFTYDNPATTGTNESSILARSSLVTKDLKPADFGGTSAANKLLELKFNVADATALKTAINANEAQGWFYKLDMFEGTNGVKGLKVFNEPDALNRRLNINVFSPETELGISNCAGGVRGSSMRQLMCLPYGACPGLETSTPFLRSGKGIVDSFVVSLNETGDSRTTIGILDTKCEGAECDRCLGDACATVCTGSSCGGGTTGGDPGFKEKLLGERDLRPLDWLQRK
jgi:type IV pilus assembly protein PilY1